MTSPDDFISFPDSRKTDSTRMEPDPEDFTPAFVARCKTLAEAGIVEGMAFYGRALITGWGGITDSAAGVIWLRRAAEAGNATGEATLGACYEVGKGVPLDTKIARYWYQKAAEKGLPRGQYMLARSYYRSYPRENDDKAKAAYWYGKAAEQGHADATFYLGLCYKYGYGVAFDINKSDALIEEAAVKGSAEAQHEYARILSALGCHDKACLWYSKAAEQGLPGSQYYLGLAYDKGLGVEKNRQKAAYWYNKAARQNYEPAIEALKVLGLYWPKPTTPPPFLAGPRHRRSDFPFLPDNV